MAQPIELQRVFRELDCIVFALGRTKAWRRRYDGAILPFAPGVVAGKFDPAAYDLVNVTMQEVASGLCGFLLRLRSVNTARRCWSIGSTIWTTSRTTR